MSPSRRAEVVFLQETLLTAEKQRQAQRTANAGGGRMWGLLAASSDARPNAGAAVFVRSWLGAPPDLVAGFTHDVCPTHRCAAPMRTRLLGGRITIYDVCMHRSEGPFNDRTKAIWATQLEYAEG